MYIGRASIHRSSIISFYSRIKWNFYNTERQGDEDNFSENMGNKEKLDYRTFCKIVLKTVMVFNLKSIIMSCKALFKIYIYEYI